MGEVLLKTCDILVGRKATAAKPVRKVRLIVQVKQDPADEDSWSVCRMAGPKDMCPDAIERAIKFAERAVTPPNVAATKAVEGGADVPNP